MSRSPFHSAEVAVLETLGGNAADTYGADARLIEFGIHYQQDSAGSLHQFIKQIRPYDNR